ncbi:MAG TPA: hypothetical protein VFS21_25400 [Roseiflexaceae bacterium]|nr:hypothetical protein [Roseiflexaceae bacterium]
MLPTTTLILPFTAPLNPYTSTLNDTVLPWALDRKMLRVAEVSHIRHAHVDRLVGWAYPHASKDALTVIHHWNLWLVLWEDYASGAGHSAALAQLRLQHRRFRAVLARRSAGNTPMERGLADIVAMFAKRLPPRWLRQFASTATNMLVSWEWEAQNRAQGLVPDVASYLAMRPVTLALLPYLDLLALELGRPLAPSARAQSLLQKAVLHASLVIALANDLVSLDKELHADDGHNLVRILMDTEGHDLETSQRMVIARHNTEMARFQISCATLVTHHGSDTDALLMMRTLKHWIAANMQWSAVSSRYQHPERASVAA